MTRVALPLALTLLVAIATSDGLAQTQPGRIVLTGVVRSDSGDPLRGARVLVRADGGGVVAEVLSTEAGRFESPVAAGPAYALLVSKAGYAPGQARVDGVSANEPVEVRLSKGAAVTGRVRDALGYPVPGATVLLQPVAVTDAPMQLLRLFTKADDLGEYRIGSLPAGQYRIHVERPTPAGISDVLSIATPMGVVSQRAAARTAGAALSNEPVEVQVQAGEENFVDLFEYTHRAETKRLAASRVGSSAFGTDALERSGTALIAGRVLAGDMRPIADAVVTLVTESGASAAASATTDDGRYEFASAPPGTYRIVARHPDFSMQGEHGSPGGLSRGNWRHVEAGDRLEGMDVVLPRDGVIAGTVVDVYGEPLEGLTVQVLQSRVRGGREEVYPVSDLRPRQTDDRGRYRIYGLPPGSYYVVARVTPTAGPWAGPAAYYPGRGAIPEAELIQVRAGTQALGVDFEFSPAPAVAVTGRVVNASGEPLRAAVKLERSRRSGAPREQAQNVVSNADGLFTFENVLPGEYVLQTERRAFLVTDGPGQAAQVSYPGTEFEFGTVFVTVAESDVGPVTLRTAPGATVTGRLVLEGPGGSLPSSAFSLGFVSADTDLGPAGLPAVRFNAVGVFLATDLVGPFRVVAGAPAGWWLKSVEIDGVNGAERAVTFGTGDAPRTEVAAVFSSTVTGISGRVLDDRNEPALGAHVIAFSSDPALRFAGSSHSRRTPAIGGEFSVGSLPPGDYYVVSVEADAIGPIEWQEADVLQRLMQFARFVSVREGGPISVDLELARLP